MAGNNTAAVENGWIAKTEYQLQNKMTDKLQNFGLTNLIGGDRTILRQLARFHVL
jgi:hypothetical protein